MPILIDGYNLLHVTGIFSNAVGPGSLKKLHAALLDFLAGAIDPAEVAQTTVVFDAKGRDAANRRSHEYSGITVHYAARHEDADTMLAELIRDHPTPRRLVVVSSDHQVQRAARRRRATAIDSDVWYMQVLRSRQERLKATALTSDAKPQAPISPSDVAWWLSQFAPELIQEMEQELSGEPVGNSQPSKKGSTTALKDSSQSQVSALPPAKDSTGDASLNDPFPQKYLEEVQREIDAGNQQPPKPRQRKRR